MAEIKISELSIGDWVRYDFPEIGKMNIQVNSIDEEDNHIGAGGVGASAWSDVSKFEPIPLTPEILEKNGFVKWHSLSNARQLKGEDFIVNITDPSDVNKAFITINGGLHKVVLPALSSVHQLQHALRLAGVEKEIEL